MLTSPSQQAAARCLGEDFCCSLPEFQDGTIALAQYVTFKPVISDNCAERLQPRSREMGKSVAVRCICIEHVNRNAPTYPNAQFLGDLLTFLGGFADNVTYQFPQCAIRGLVLWSCQFIALI